MASSCRFQVEALMSPRARQLCLCPVCSRDQESPSRALLPELGNTVATNEHFYIQHKCLGFVQKLKT